MKNGRIDFKFSQLTFNQIIVKDNLFNGLDFTATNFIRRTTKNLT